MDCGVIEEIAMRLSWEFEPPETTAIIISFGHFNARGMKRVYGRGDHMGPGHTFNMDIWKDRNGRLFMRCWSRCADIDWRSYEIKRMDINSIPVPDKGHVFEAGWLPREVRSAYEQWIEEQ